MRDCRAFSYCSRDESSSRRVRGEEAYGVEETDAEEEEEEEDDEDDLDWLLYPLPGTVLLEGEDKV